jgi:hypothetical protein
MKLYTVISKMSMNRISGILAEGFEFRENPGFHNVTETLGGRCKTQIRKTCSTNTIRKAVSIFRM